MGDRAEEMVRISLDAFAERDVEKARELVDLDELIDRTNRRVTDHVLEPGAEPGQQEWGMRMIVVSRCLERVGDNAVDIGEQVEFLVTGEFHEFTDASHLSAFTHASPIFTSGQPTTGSTDATLASADRLGGEPASFTVDTGEGRRDMKRALALVLALVALVAVALVAGRAQAAPAASTDTNLTGAGASFPFPLISKWIPELGKAYGINVTYSPTGSGAGIAAITARTVDFGASDAPLSSSQLDACKGCVADPLGALGDVDSLQPPGLERPAEARRPDAREHLPRADHELERSRDQAAEPEPEPARSQDHAGLPLRRLRARRTTSPSTSRPSSPAFKSGVGFNTSVSWKTGVGARGSSGVTGVVRQTAGALTYVDVAYSIAEQAPVRDDQEQGRQVRDARPPRDPAGRLAAAEEGHEPLSNWDRRIRRRRPASSPTRSSRSPT